MDREHTVIRAPKAFLWIGIADIAIFGACLGMAFGSSDEGTVDALVYIIFAFFLLLGALLVLEVLLFRLDVYEYESYFRIRSTLVFKGIPLKTYAVYYRDCVGYKLEKNTLTLKTEDKTFYLEPYYPKINVFIIMLNQHNVKPLMQNRNEEHIAVRPPKHLFVVGLAFVLILAGFIGATIWDPTWIEGTDSIGAWVVFGLLLLMGVVITLEGRLGRMDVFRHENYFRIRSFFSLITIPFKTYELSYSDCKSYKITGSGELLLRAKGHIFYIEGNYSNLDVFKDMLRQHEVKER